MPEAVPNDLTHFGYQPTFPGTTYDERVEAAGDLRATMIALLRSSGAQFALVFGSQARGTAGPTSDLDVGAWWARDAPLPWELELPAGVDLVDVSHVPLEVAGRIACEGQLLFDDNPNERVHWVATTRKVWLDESFRFARSHREFLEAAAHGR